MNEYKQTVGTNSIVTRKLKDVGTKDFAKIGDKFCSYQKEEGKIGGKLGSYENEADVMLLSKDDMMKKEVGGNDDIHLVEVIETADSDVDLAAKEGVPSSMVRCYRTLWFLA
jgi:hypothetical protein